MEHVWLSRNEKRALRALASPGPLPQALSPALCTLERKGLARAARGEGGEPVDARLTTAGKALLAANPALRNPFPSPPVAVAALLTLAALCAALCAVMLFKIML